MKLQQRLLTLLVVPAFLFMSLMPTAEASSHGYQAASKYMSAKKKSKKLAKKDSRHGQKRKVASTKHKKHGKHKKKKHRNN
jgi:hypothetical protein